MILVLGDFFIREGNPQSLHSFAAGIRSRENLLIAGPYTDGTDRLLESEQNFGIETAAVLSRSLFQFIVKLRGQIAKRHGSHSGCIL